MGHGKTIEIRVSDHKVTVRDYGRGIPLGKVVDCVSKINTGGKYDTAAFQKSVGLNGVGTKAVTNPYALSALLPSVLQSFLALLLSSWQNAIKLAKITRQCKQHNRQSWQKLKSQLKKCMREFFI